jgi:phosphatidylinositol 3-kinase
VILNYPPGQPLTSEEKDLIWKFRFYLARDKKGLTKFLKSVSWRDSSEVKQAVEELLPMWTEIDTDDALELLGPGTVDSRVRAFAVKQLSRADDDVSHVWQRDQFLAEFGVVGTATVLASTGAGTQVRECYY